MQQQPSSRSNTIRCTTMHRPVNRSPTAAESATKAHGHASPIHQPLGRATPRPVQASQKGSEASMHCTRPHGPLLWAKAHEHATHMQQPLG
eukprot:4533166-Alexandrium_andersonii.AAC.1